MPYSFLDKKGLQASLVKCEWYAQLQIDITTNTLILLSNNTIQGFIILNIYQ